MTSLLMMKWYVLGSRLWVAMALRTDQGESCPRVRRWLTVVGSSLMGTGVLGAGVSSLGSLGVGAKGFG